MAEYLGDGILSLWLLNMPMQLTFDRTGAFVGAEVWNDDCAGNSVRIVLDHAFKQQDNEIKFTAGRFDEPVELTVVGDAALAEAFDDLCADLGLDGPHPLAPTLEADDGGPDDGSPDDGGSDDGSGDAVEHVADLLLAEASLEHKRVAVERRGGPKEIADLGGQRAGRTVAWSDAVPTGAAADPEGARKRHKVRDDGALAGNI